MGLRIVGLDGHGLLGVRQGLVEPPVLDQDLAQIVMGLGVVGIEPERLLKLVGCLVEMAPLTQSRAEVVMRSTSSGLISTARRNRAMASSLRPRPSKALPRLQ